MKVSCGKLSDLSQNVEVPPPSAGGGGPVHRVPFASVAFQPVVPWQSRKYYRLLAAGNSSVSVWALEILPAATPVRESKLFKRSSPNNKANRPTATEVVLEISQGGDEGVPTDDPMGDGPAEVISIDTAEAPQQGGESANPTLESSAPPPVPRDVHDPASSRWLHSEKSGSRIKSHRLQRLGDHAPSYVVRLAWSPDGTRWASADSTQVILWRLKSSTSASTAGASTCSPAVGSGTAGTGGSGTVPAGGATSATLESSSGELWGRYKTLIEPAVSEIFDICWVSPTRIAIGGLERVIIKDVGRHPAVAEEDGGGPKGGGGSSSAAGGALGDGRGYTDSIGAFGTTSATGGDGGISTISIQLADFAICKGLACRPRWVSLDEEDDDRPNKPPTPPSPTAAGGGGARNRGRSPVTPEPDGQQWNAAGARSGQVTSAGQESAFATKINESEIPCYLAVSTNVKKAFVYEIKGNRAKLVSADWTLFSDGPMDTPLIRHCSLDPLSNLAAFSFGERRNQTFAAVYDLSEVNRAVGVLRSRGEINPFQTLFELEQQAAEEKRVAGGGAEKGDAAGNETQQKNQEGDLGLLLFKDARFRTRGHQTRVSAVAFGNGVYSWQPDLSVLIPRGSERSSNDEKERMRIAYWNQLRDNILESQEFRNAMFKHSEWPKVCRLAQCSVDGSLSVWDIVQPTDVRIVTGTCLFVMPPSIVDQTGLIADMSWSWDDKLLAIASDDGKLTCLIFEEEGDAADEGDAARGDEPGEMAIVIDDESPSESVEGGDLRITVAQASRSLAASGQRIAYSYQHWLSTQTPEAQDPVLPSPTLARGGATILPTIPEHDDPNSGAKLTRREDQNVSSPGSPYGARMEGVGSHSSLPTSLGGGGAVQRGSQSININFQAPLEAADNCAAPFLRFEGGPQMRRGEEGSQSESRMVIDTPEGGIEGTRMPPSTMSKLLPSPPVGAYSRDSPEIIDV